MYPTLNFLVFKISSYLFFLFTTFVVVIVGSYLFAIKRQFKQKDILIMLFGMAISVFIGARFLNIIVNYKWYQNDFWRIFDFSTKGLSLYGGAMLAILIGGIISYFRKIYLWKFADTVTPFLAIGIALMRVGCFLNGCCFGRETNVLWGVIFPKYSLAHIHQLSSHVMSGGGVVAVHPTQIYELLAALLGGGMAILILKKSKTHGVAFLSFVIFFSVFRWGNMYLRVLPYDKIIINFVYPALYILIILGSICCLFFINKKHN